MTEALNHGDIRVQRLYGPSSSPVKGHVTGAIVEAIFGRSVLT
jgi:hypothetical protein